MCEKGARERGAMWNVQNVKELCVKELNVTRVLRVRDLEVS